MKIKVYSQLTFLIRNKGFICSTLLCKKLTITHSWQQLMVIAHDVLYQHYNLCIEMDQYWEVTFIAGMNDTLQPLPAGRKYFLLV